MPKNSESVLRVARPIPIVGQLSSLARTRETLNEKGAMLGAVDIALDLFPVVGRVKGFFEIFCGDIVNEENLRRGLATMRDALDQIESSCLPSDKDTPSMNETNIDSEEASDEDRVYPRNSARMAMQRARVSIQRPYEKRTYAGLE